MISILNAIIFSLGAVISGILLLLPPSPFQFVQQLDNSFLDAMNYLFPFNSVIAHLQLYVVAVGLYYAVRVVLRWIKVAGQ